MKIRHTRFAIAKKLQQAAELENLGLRQPRICKELGISVMTLHRWRKQASASTSPLGKLLDENIKLRRLVATLQLELASLESALVSRRPVLTHLAEPISQRV